MKTAGETPKAALRSTFLQEQPPAPETTSRPRPQTTTFRSNHGGEETHTAQADRAHHRAGEKEELPPLP